VNPDQLDQLTTGGPLLLAALVSVLAGLVSFASPCVVPLVPGYLSYLAAVVGVDGPAAARAAALADGTWVRVEGTIPAGQGDSSMRSTPTMQVVAVQEIEAPENPYSY